MILDSNLITQYEITNPTIKYDKLLNTWKLKRKSSQVYLSKRNRVVERNQRRAWNDLGTSIRHPLNDLSSRLSHTMVNNATTLGIISHNDDIVPHRQHTTKECGHSLSATTMQKGPKMQDREREWERKIVRWVSERERESGSEWEGHLVLVAGKWLIVVRLALATDNGGCNAASGAQQSQRKINAAQWLNTRNKLLKKFY